MHSKQRCRIVTAIAACWLTPAIAQNADTDDIAVSCQIPAADRVASRHFSALQGEARRLNDEACAAFLTRDFQGFDARQRELYRGFGESAKDTALGFLTSQQIENKARPFDPWIAKISSGEFVSKALPDFFVVPPLQPADQSLFYHFGDLSNRGTVSDRGDSTCGSGRDESCQALLDDFAVAVNDYNYGYAQLSAQDTARTLDALSSQWDDYLNNSRSQTLLDIALTTIIERSHFRKGYLVGPPKRQWSLLKPNLVLEHADDAPDGERDEFTVAVEWIGVNWWSEDSPVFGKPFGISFASIYADRPNYESVGHGVMLHIDNSYSLGWASRSGDDSFYLSLDLLKFFEDQERQLGRYRRELFE